MKNFCNNFSKRFCGELKCEKNILRMATKNLRKTLVRTHTHTYTYTHTYNHAHTHDYNTLSPTHTLRKNKYFSKATTFFCSLHFIFYSFFFFWYFCFAAALGPRPQMTFGTAAKFCALFLRFRLFSSLAAATLLPPPLPLPLGQTLMKSFVKNFCAGNFNASMKKAPPAAKLSGPRGAAGRERERQREEEGEREREREGRGL